jgi:hypothetical protein
LEAWAWKQEWKLATLRKELLRALPEELQALAWKLLRVQKETTLRVIRKLEPMAYELLVLM